MSWNQRLDHQLKLDRCVGESVKSIYRYHQEIVVLNRAILAGRATLAVGQVVPAIAATARAGLALAKIRQEALLLQWNGLPIRLAAEDCPPEVLLSFPFTRWKNPTPLQDQFGPRALIWQANPHPAFEKSEGTQPKFSVDFTARVLRWGVRSAAGLSPQPGWPCHLETGVDCAWKVHWGSPSSSSKGIRPHRTHHLEQSTDVALQRDP
jgi:hypothetical protein